MSSPAQLIVRLGEDLNWWPAAAPQRGILDPRQVAHLVSQLDQLEPHGLGEHRVAEAFRMYAVESELGEGQLRLRMVAEPLQQTGEQLFALPLVDAAGEGPYLDFLAALSTARIRQLNATHQYACPCTELEMQDELDALDSDRYFSDDTIHAFDEISEILTWSPAEWDSFDT